MCLFESNPIALPLEAEAELPQYSTLTASLLPPLYVDRREREGKLIRCRSQPTKPTLPSVIFFESLIATIFNSACLLFLLYSTDPFFSFSFSTPSNPSLRRYILLLVLLILFSCWISIYQGTKCLILKPEESFKQNHWRQSVILIGTIFSISWMWFMMAWISYDKQYWLRIDLGILIACTQFAIAEEVYYQSAVEAQEELERIELIDEGEEESFSFKSIEAGFFQV